MEPGGPAAFAFGVFFVLLGCLSLLNTIWPRRMWSLLEALRFANPAVVEPSDLVLAWYRVSGVAGFLAFVAVGVPLFVVDSPAERAAERDRRQAHCDEVMTELQNAWAGGGRSAVEARAERFDVRLERRDREQPGFGVHEGDQFYGFVPVTMAGTNCLRID